MQCRQQVAAVLLSLEDELAVLDLRYADLLQSVQSLANSEEDNVEVHAHSLIVVQLNREAPVLLRCL